VLAETKDGHLAVFLFDAFKNPCHGQFISVGTVKKVFFY